MLTFLNSKSNNKTRHKSKNKLLEKLGYNKHLAAGYCKKNSDILNTLN